MQNKLIIISLICLISVIPLSKKSNFQMLSYGESGQEKNKSFANG